MRSVAGGLKRGVGEPVRASGKRGGRRERRLGIPRQGNGDRLPDRCRERSSSGPTTSPGGGSASSWIAKLSRTCRPVTAWAASARLAEKWPLDPFAKEGVGHLDLQSVAITAEPEPDPLAKPEAKSSSPSRSATAARSADSKARWSAVAVEPGTPSCTWPGCATIAPSPAPSSVWAYACVLAWRLLWRLGGNA